MTRSRPDHVVVILVARTGWAGEKIMTITASGKDLQHLVSGERVPLDVTARVFQEHFLLLADEVDYANTLMKDAGTYLGSWALRRFIRAELSEDVAREVIASNRVLLSRMQGLFPEIVRQLRITDPNRARITFNIVFDTCSDYQAILANGRREANRRKLIQRMVKLQQRVFELSKLLSDSDVTHEGGFEPAQRLYMKRVHGKAEEARPFWKLERDVRFLSGYLELEVYRARTKPNSVRVPDNQAKSHIVNAVYELVLSEGNPRFVTTPGSEFSYLCSLLFEIATGTPDESLAGAISRYARSSERAEADQQEIDYGEERNRARDEDNFYDIKNSTFGSDQQVAELQAELRDKTLSPEARLLVMCELEEMVEAVENRDRVHGSFIMWADQIKIDWAEQARARDARNREELQRDIETGKQRRSKRPLST
ncbi:hypothetical protein LB543_32175 [Mesorhizobium sp. ESP7-2]|uniref:hypothetical protein n=1 Tax=Mesorhizobium sp. ESP7-2 TaxID=2876622 RepID=UPI001CCB1EC9|nr:hypothetical protein [Mesorhizobium sp. ESP7-2]MBZ9711356.1 hypothetical protein [Mesorhizobium sp. ESP7-2]